MTELERAKWYTYPETREFGTPRSPTPAGTAHERRFDLSYYDDKGNQDKFIFPLENFHIKVLIKSQDCMQYDLAKDLMQKG